MSDEVARPLTLSVIVPNFNHGRFLADAVEGLLAQSHPPDEVVIVDDASTDDSRAVARELAARHPEVTLVCNECNVGVNASVQRGLQCATGEYLFLFAADDQVVAGFFEAALDLLSRHRNAGVCIGLAAFLDEDTGTVTRPRWRRWVPPNACFVPPDRIGTFTRKGMALGGNAAIVRRGPFEEAHGFREDLRWYADWFCLEVVAFRTGLCILPEDAVVVRKSRGSYSATASRKERRQTLLVLLGLLDGPIYRDTRRSFRQGALSNCEALLFGLLVTHPRLWGWLTPSYLRLRAIRAVRNVVRPFF